MAKKEENADFLKPITKVLDADPRTNSFVKYNSTKGTWDNLSIEDYHNDVQYINLNASVPEDILVHFETAKNLHLYSWFVYRFFPIADQQAMFCVEFALRERFRDDENAPRNKTLKKLLNYAIKTSRVKNEGFSVWKNRVRMNSENRHRFDLIKKMNDEGLEEIIIDESDIEIKEEDMQFNYVETLKESLPFLRNEYAHGSSMLHNHSLTTIIIASEIINQLYPEA